APGTHDIRDLVPAALEMIRTKRGQYRAGAMPAISANRKDLDKLLGRRVTDKELEAWLPLVKGEIKEVDTATGEIRFELQDSNRPDLWSVEGIARQIRIKLNG